MPRIRIDDSLTMYYEDDSFVEPWRTPEVILLVHGLAENSTVWYAWVPRLAHKYAVIRVDLRGWGKSSIPPDGYRWSTANFAEDIKVLLDRLKLEKVHLVGAKTGGTISLQFAHDYPERLHSLTVIGAPMQWKMQPIGGDYARTIREKGLEYYARITMEGRLGDVSEEMSTWWIKLFSKNSPRVTSEILDYFRTMDLTSLLPRIKVPTLVIAGESEVIAPAQSFKEWQQSIPDSELAIIPGKGFHIAAVRPAECTAILLDFLARISCRVTP